VASTYVLVFMLISSRLVYFIYLVKFSYLPVILCDSQVVFKFHFGNLDVLQFPSRIHGCPTLIFRLTSIHNGGL